MLKKTVTLLIILAIFISYVLLQNYQPQNKQSIVVAMVEKDNKILITLHIAKNNPTVKWAFPMGKVETGETLASCLKRQLQEELGILAQIGSYVGTTSFGSEHQEYELHAFRVTEFSGQIILNDANAKLVWITPNELLLYDMLEIQKPFVKLLQENSFSVNPIKSS